MSARTFLVAGNWKMQGTLELARELAGGIARAYKAEKGFEVACIPPAPFLVPVRDALADSGVHLGGQDLSPQPDGAYTGDVSATMLVDVGCRYALVGHSERRQYHGEQAPVLRLKLARALRAGLHPIFCVGEPLSVRRLGGELAHVEDQVLAVLREFVKASDDGDSPAAGLAPIAPTELTIAYEPIWAIGTGEVATTEQAQTMCAHIRHVVVDLGGEAWGNVAIQYGGSVKPDNAHDIAALPDCDGMLVGGASLKVDSFNSIIEESRRALAKSS